jgi:hypothetical protein
VRRPARRSFGPASSRTIRATIGMSGRRAWAEIVMKVLSASPLTALITPAPLDPRRAQGVVFVALPLTIGRPTAVARSSSS